MTKSPRMAALVHNDGMEPTIRRGSIAVAEYPELTAKRWDIIGYRSPLSVEQACHIAARDSAFFGGMNKDKVAEFYKAHLEVFGPMRIHRVGRVVALGGETFMLRGDGIYIDTKKIDPPWSIAHLYQDVPDAAWRAHFSGAPIQIPEHQVYVLQDNLSKGHDSRTLGLVKLTSIVGTLNDVILPETVMSADFFVTSDRVPHDLLQDLEEQHGPRSTWFKPN